ncbi:uncharacterized protein LOC119159871 isoform X1 [Rhipicephalus microplus]|uniref:uncharacterized protein LOC119159871 isoform X1 n=1 Tax=Rhipicephalus microplus TaxID=6941 RepID=UPI003F6D0DB7
MAAGRRQTRSAAHSGQASSSTVTPSSYERNIGSISPDHTTITNIRERTMVLVLSGLLLFISGSLFAILLGLISEDYLVTGAWPKLYCPALPVLNFLGSSLPPCFGTRTIKTINE